jgi:hypothetical protein
MLARARTTASREDPTASIMVQSPNQILRRHEKFIMAKKRTKTDDLYVDTPKGATRRQMHDAAWAAFTAADLQKYTEIEPMIPAEQLLQELKAIHKAELAKQNAKKKNKRR